MKRILNKWQICVLALFSLVFAFVFILGRNITYSGGISGYPTENYMTMPGIDDALIFMLALAVSFALMSLLLMLCKKIELSPNEKNRRKAVRWLTFAFVLAAWSPYILSCCPGVLYGDSLSTLSSFVKLGYPDSNHHPVLYTYAMGSFYNIGCAMGSGTMGLFAFTLIQCCIMAFAAAKTVEFVYNCGAGKVVVAVCTMFYAFLPNFPVLALGFLKDPFYSCAMMWLMFELLDFSRQREWGMGIIKIAAVSFLLCFLRNNGIYVIIVTAVCVVLMMKKTRIKTALVFLCLILAYYSITIPGYKKLGIDQEFVESVGIPVQQLGAVIWYEGNLSDEEQQYLFELMPQWAWQENYSPCLVDNIKWNYFFNEEFLEETKGEFIKTWATVLMKNPVIYIRAYLMETHGFWKPGSRDIYGLGGLDVLKTSSREELGIGAVDYIEALTGKSILPALQSMLPNISAGTLLWIMLAAAVLCILQKKSTWIVFVPAFANWLTVMISTPVAYSLRYVYIFVFALPLFLLVPFIAEKKKSSEE